jgi:hypothetical protein
LGFSSALFPSDSPPKPCRHLSFPPYLLHALPISACTYTAFCRAKFGFRFYWFSSSPNIIQGTKSRRLRWAGQVARMGARRGAYRVLVGKPEGRRPLGSAR